MVNRLLPFDPDLGSWWGTPPLREGWKGAEIILILPFYGGTREVRGKLSEHWMQEDLAGQVCGSKKN